MNVNELIWFQLKGKLSAMERYDAILWKVRAGYLAVLYGVATILGGKDFHILGADLSPQAVVLFCCFAWALSVSAMLVDINFLLSKLRVYQAYNRLSDIALELADGAALSLNQKQALAEFLHISGESSVSIERRVLARALWPVLPIYFTAPLASLLVIIIR